jgi:hypothetical protein
VSHGRRPAQAQRSAPRSGTERNAASPRYSSAAALESRREPQSLDNPCVVARNESGCRSERARLSATAHGRPVLFGSARAIRGLPVGGVRREGNVGRVPDDLSTAKRATSGGDLACFCVACARNKLVQSPWRARSPLSFRGDFALSRLRPGNLSRTRSRRPRISAICDKNLVRRELNARQRGVRAASEPAPQRFAQFEDELESARGRRHGSDPGGLTGGRADRACQGEENPIDARR